MNRSITTSALAILLLAACSAADDSAQPAPGSDPADTPEITVAAGLEGASYTATQEFGGYYLPVETVSIGPIQLDHISLGSDWEFDAFHNGDPDAFPPLQLHFDDTSSPTGTNPELGNTYYEVTYRFAPAVYAVSDEGLSFAGEHELLGEIRFAGTWNTDQVGEMQDGNPQNAEAALTGDLAIGDVVFEDVTFQGWLGD
jgi:hypothetical protein